jgi:hypothetical protein
MEAISDSANHLGRYTMAALVSITKSKDRRHPDTGLKRKRKEKQAVVHSSLECTTARFFHRVRDTP